MRSRYVLFLTTALAFVVLLSLIAFPVDIPPLNSIAYTFTPFHDKKSDDFFAYTRDIGDVEHYYYYSDYCGIMDNVRDAEVLFLGNSRVVQAINMDLVNRSLAKYGMRGYMLGFGYAESATFALNLLRKHHLKPKYVIINAQKFFIKPSKVALLAMEKTTLESYKIILQRTTRFQLQAMLPPSLGGPKDQYAYPKLLFRSRATGDWNLAYRNAIRTRTPDKPIPLGKHSYAFDQAIYDEFMEHLRENNITPIFLYVPTHIAKSYKGAEKFFKKNDLFFIPNDYRFKLYTYDKSHLHPKSETDFTKHVLRHLEKDIFPALGVKKVR